MSDQEDQSSTAAHLGKPAELEAEFERLLEREKLESLAEFAAGAGHEINNPLTVISGRAQLLLREESDPERQHALALIIAQAMRVHEMIADMMLFARPPKPELQPVDLRCLIDQLTAELLPRCQQQDTELIHTGNDAAPLPIEADPVQLMVALRAICQNSLDALQSGGRIEIHAACGFWENVDPAASQSPDAALVRISDNGPGLKPEERRHAFDPFYSARQAGRGLGLGLSKAWRIVTNHGGRIDVHSQPGQGATVIVSLPMSPPVTPNPAEAVH